MTVISSRTLSRPPRSAMWLRQPRAVLARAVVPLIVLMLGWSVLAEPQPLPQPQPQPQMQPLHPQSSHESSASHLAQYQQHMQRYEPHNFHEPRAQQQQHQQQQHHYGQRHPDPRYPVSQRRHDPRRDPRYDPRATGAHDPQHQHRTQQQPSTPTRRPETARYDPRMEAFMEELSKGPSLLPESTESRSASYEQEYIPQRRRIYTEFDELGEQKGNWSEWSTLAPCSRTCGGGVTFRQRSCLEDPCVGPSRIYSSCNTNACPEGEPAAQQRFLERQCQRMNSVPYDDKFYSWIPRRRHDRNPCELNCTPKDRDLELKSRQNVIDGTRCYHVGFDQCVEGQCVPTGCDGLLGSRKRIDKCLVCGGKGKDCNTTYHTETQLQPGYGYRPVYVIPAGATSVVMREIEPSTNYLSLRDLHGTYYLNKDYEIDYSKAFMAGGAKWHYIRNSQYENGREHLRTDGPTNETLVIALLVQEMNRGYDVEYSLKQVPGQPRHRSGEYQWELGEWEPCYDPCGEIHTNRTVRCASIISRLQASDEDECDLEKKPPSTQPCPTDNCQAEWYTGEWERCSNTCGNGTQTRVVFCSTAAGGGGGVRVLPDRLCQRPESGERPPTEQECESKLSCDLWETGDWAEPERKCGPTKRLREVKCVTPMENSPDGVMDGVDCLPEDRPAEEEQVLLEPCNGAEWATGEWSSCEACGSTVQTRTVSCILDDGTIYNETHCDGKPKPETERECEDPPQCEFRWFSSEWSPCSVTCGSGVRSRSVFCGQLEVNSTCPTMVDESNCQGDKPVAREPCENDPCKQFWLAGPWSRQCPENACGGLPRKRAVFCYVGDDGLAATDCEDADGSKPADTEDCSPQACPADQIDVLGSCAGTEHGCCPDNETAADADFQQCPPFDRENATTPCSQTEWGCCRDLVTPAFGPFNGGCSRFGLCNGTEFGCCEDGVTRAQGPNSEGCDVPCEQTEFGCCEEDGKTTKLDENNAGCPTGANGTETLAAEDVAARQNATDTVGPVEEDAVDSGSGGGSGDSSDEGSDAAQTDVGSGAAPTEQLDDDELLVASNCTESEHGCCADGLTPARDPEKRRGCPHCRISKFGCCPDGVTAALGRKFNGCADTCTNSTFGCCPDGFFSAEGPSLEGCQLRDCKESKFGCCSKLAIPATDVEDAGCQNCTDSAYGCCSDGETFALGPRGEGCCDDNPHGCCPDGKTLAQGPDLAGCPCQTLEFGCCPDRVTPALGPDHFGCTCETSEFGCCSDLLTPALGPGQANCTCDRLAFGCCPDGITPATGPDSQYSCDCRTSQFGCCADNRTPATGPSGRGCYCATMKYGCCQDQRTPAAGPNQLGCPCSASTYGCCADGVTPALDAYNVGCQDCTKLKYGCCPDGVYAARGPNFEGCPCDTTEFGCCPDRRTPAQGPDAEGCPEVPCQETQFGCCPDGTMAKGRYYEGCNLDEETRRRYEEHLRSLEGRHRQPPSQPHQTAAGAGASPLPHGSTHTPHYPHHVVTKPPYYEPRRIKEACFQANDRGQCGNWTLVWYFDYKESRCMRFYYGGCGGNDNRFADEHSCQSLCDESSVGGRDRLPHQPPIDNEVVPTAAPRTARYPCDLPKDVGPCKQHQERYWFNEQTNQCERFVYGGCHGNANNFPSHKACANRCRVMSDLEKCTIPKVVSKNCTDPKPLFRFDFKMQRCEHYKGCTEDVNVFKEYESCVGTCVQRNLGADLADSVCSLAADAGPCGDFTLQWYYDKANERCAQFYYGDCEGNANRFTSESECQHFCGQRAPSIPPALPPTPPTPHVPPPSGSPPVIPSSPAAAATSLPVCEQPRDIGPCDSYEIRYHFDMHTRTCAPFHYGGCQGNQNNFATLDDCQRYCGFRYGGLAPPPPPPPPTSPRHQPAVPFHESDCLEPKHRGSCSGQTRMFYYYRTDGVCREFTYSGCGGNRNRFTTRSECEQSCRNAQDPCRLPTIKGRCGGSYKLWSYDSHKDICKQFDYSGCSGNANRFDSKVDCENRCVRRSLHVNGTSVDLPDKCRLRSDPGSCVHRMAKFYFDLRLGKCLPFHWGGCEGNDNRFETLNDCEKECLIPAISTGLVSPNRENSLDEYRITSPSSRQDDDKHVICNLASSTGSDTCPSAQPSYRYHYDAPSLRCLPFVYYGCEGNQNNFITLEKCEAFCAGVRSSESDDYTARIHHSSLETPRRPHVPPSVHYPDVTRHHVDSAAAGHHVASGTGHHVASGTGHHVASGTGHHVAPAGAGHHVASGTGHHVAPAGAAGHHIASGTEHHVGPAGAAGHHAVASATPGQHAASAGTYYSSSAAGHYGTVQCPPDNCGRANCRGLGERREVLPNGCVRCRCNHPCDEVHCKAGERCGIELSEEGKYVGLCKLINKPGECPELKCNDNDASQHRRDQCRDDAECQGAQKCCSNGCHKLCTDADHKGAEDAGDLEEVVVVEGELAQLKCPVEIGSTPVWTKSGEFVDGDRTDFDLETLKITEVSKEDAGVYVCEDPEDPMIKGRIALRISEAPTIAKDKPVVEAALNTTANLTCQVVGGYPRPSVSWRRGDISLPARSSKYRQLPENTLQVLSVQAEDQDIYLCTATNQRGQAQFLVALVIPVADDPEHQERGEIIAQQAKDEAEN